MIDTCRILAFIDTCRILALIDTCQILALIDRCRILALIDRCQILALIDRCQILALIDRCQIHALIDRCQILALIAFGEANCRGSWWAAVWSCSYFSMILSVHLNGTEVSDTGLQSFSQLGDLFLGTRMTVEVFQMHGMHPSRGEA